MTMARFINIALDAADLESTSDMMYRSCNKIFATAAVVVAAAVVVVVAVVT